MTASSATTRSCPEAKRSSRGFSRHRATIAATCGDTCRAVTDSSGGVSSRIALSVAIGVSRRNGCLPLSSS